MIYQRQNSTYQSNAQSYVSSSATYKVSGYSEDYSSTKGICRGTCKMYGVCSCGAH